MDSLYNTHIKLLAFDFLYLSSSSLDSNSFFRKGIPLSRAETLGIVVSRELKLDKFLKFTFNEGTGCIPCILWLNQLKSPYFSHRNPSDVRLIATVAANSTTDIKLCVVTRVWGRITVYRGSLQITVSEVVVERDPNVEMLHCLDYIKLARKCYDVMR